MIQLWYVFFTNFWYLIPFIILMLMVQADFSFGTNMCWTLYKHTLYPYLKDIKSPWYEEVHKKKVVKHA
jgi:hypothetical protein